MKFLDDIFGFPFPAALIGWGFVGWGVFNFLTMLIACVMFPLIMQMMPGYINQLKQAMNSAYLNFFIDHWIISFTLGFLLAFLMILGGFNFLRRKRWAKYLLEGICWYTIIMQSIGLLCYLNMDYAKLMSNMGMGNMPPQANQSVIIGMASGLVAGIFTSLVFLAVMIFIIIFLHTKKIRVIFQ